MHICPCPDSDEFSITLPPSSAWCTICRAEWLIEAALAYINDYPYWQKKARTWLDYEQGKKKE